MINKKINRLWNNLVSIRDYEVKKAMEEGKSFKITVKDEPGYMIITPKQMAGAFSVVKHGFQSKFNQNQKYKLIDFSWRPADERQGELL